MGGIGSGHFRLDKRLTVEECERIAVAQVRAGRVPRGFPHLRWTETMQPFGGSFRWMICPTRSCNRRCRVLYNAGLSWACRRCLRLTYQSRRDDRTQRALRKADKLRAQVGDSPLGGSWMRNGYRVPRWARAGKRKWMHWRTFREAQDKADTIELQALSRDVNRLLSRVR